MDRPEFIGPSSGGPQMSIDSAHHAINWYKFYLLEGYFVVSTD